MEIRLAKKWDCSASGETGPTRKINKPVRPTFPVRMKKTLIFLGSLVVAILAISAGCVSPPAGHGTTVTSNGSGNSPVFVPSVPALIPGTAAGSPGSIAAQGDTVSVYYTAMFVNGTVFDSNMDNPAPLVFTLGNSSVLPGFEEAVTGMGVNQTKTVTVPAAKAYGEYNASLVRTVNRTGPIANTTFTVGEVYTIRDRTTGSYSIVRILNITPATVTWDANSPLAGLDLRFTIRLAGISRP